MKSGVLWALVLGGFLGGCSGSRLVVVDVSPITKEVILEKKGSAKAELQKTYFVYRMVIGDPHESASQAGATCAHDQAGGRAYQRKKVGYIRIRQVSPDGTLVGEILEGEIRKGDIID